MAPSAPQERSAPPTSPPDLRRRRRWVVLVLAMLLPTVITLLHLVILAGGGAGNSGQQVAYVGGTIVLLVLPVACVSALERRWPRPGRPSLQGVLYGLYFGLAVMAGMLVLYHGWLRDTSLLARTAEQVRHKFSEFGIASPLGFVLFAVFLTVLHSLFEEYYWRWFVFGWLRRLTPTWLAALLSSLAFALHHVVLLWVWFPDQPLVALFFSFCVAVGGAVWCWLYQQTGSLYASWLSHLIVDAAVFVVAYDLYFVRGRS